MKQLPIVLFLFIVQLSNAQNLLSDSSKWQKISRGNVNWKKSSVSIKDCYIHYATLHFKSFEYSFEAKSISSERDVQIWSGFGFEDRDTRYALALRGGANNDLYLCKYKSGGANKLLAVTSVDFKILTNTNYRFRIIFLEGQIRIYLNDEKKPRIAFTDEDPIFSGGVILGGGWIETEYKNVRINEISKELIPHYLNDTTIFSNIKSKEEKEQLRILQRKAYSPIKITKLSPTRTVVSLNGNWLFQPAYESKNTKPYSLSVEDFNWHILQVPDFWNPVSNWCHEAGTDLKSKQSTISDNYREKEEKRCNSYTFDYSKTNAGWYRQWVVVPNNVVNLRTQLHFDAISKYAELYVNGIYVGKHIGMFGDFSFDISKQIKPGKNLISIYVKNQIAEKSKDADQQIARAVSVDITNDMLNSLPRGMYTGTEGGIWQPVKMVFTQTVQITDVYANMKMDGGNIELNIKNTEQKQLSLDVITKIRDKKTNEVIYSKKTVNNIINASDSIKQFIIKTGKLQPKLWSPENPNLYLLSTAVYLQNQLVDSEETEIGFRTFETKGDKFYLNNKPYWIRGANQPPNAIAPNDEKLAYRFLELMHNGNETFTRTHGSPFTDIWLKAADEKGVGVSYEGTWPWLMISDIPSADLLEIWKQEMLSLVKKYRNHPSVLIWTINNEMYFTMFNHNDAPEIRIKKWKIISDLIKEVRKLSPNTLISADSGYDRVAEDYERNLKPNGIDDGDMDDRHIYFNWYNKDFFQIINGEWDKRIYWSAGANANRPFFSQENSTGYLNNDNGHFCRKYIFKHYVPQAWIGDWAYEDKNPIYGLQRHAFMTKELLEVIRRTSNQSAGTLLFSNISWFKNVFDANQIQPYPVYESVKKAASPILTSVELFGRNFYSGNIIHPKFCIVNNSADGNQINNAMLHWSIKCQDKILSEGIKQMPIIPFYEKHWDSLSIQLPHQIPAEKSNCELVVQLVSNNKIISENSYELLIAQKKWVEIDHKFTKNIGVYDITGETYKVLDFMGIKYQKLNDLTAIRTNSYDLLIVANLDADNEAAYNLEDLRVIAKNGTNILMIHPGKHLKSLYPDKIAALMQEKGRVVNMKIPEDAVFNDLEPMELSWWQKIENNRPIVCRYSYQLKNNANAVELCTFLREHVYLSNPKEQLYELSGSPLLEFTEGNNFVVGCEMEINAGLLDPIPAKLLLNMIKKYTEK